MRTPSWIVKKIVSFYIDWLVSPFRLGAYDKSAVLCMPRLRYQNEHPLIFNT